MCESATYFEYSQNIFPPQGVVINLNVSFSRRHRSEGLGEAGATAAHLSGPKLHQQVRHTQSYTFTHAQKHPSTEGTIVPPVKVNVRVSVCICGLRRTSPMTDFSHTHSSDSSTDQHRKPHKTITFDSLCSQRITACVCLCVVNRCVTSH